MPLEALSAWRSRQNEGQRRRAEPIGGLVIPPCSRRTILVVDDEPDVREIAEQMLTRLGFTVVPASCGSDALAWLRRHPGAAAAVLLDLSMPELDGGAVARAIAELQPGIPIVLVSGHHAEHARARVPDGVPVSFLQKPFSGRDLAHALRDRLLVA
jgi:two-component system cell cycle sensor histidine kinase/response regulator CckA